MNKNIKSILKALEDSFIKMSYVALGSIIILFPSIFLGVSFSVLISRIIPQNKLVNLSEGLVITLLMVITLVATSFTAYFFLKLLRKMSIWKKLESLM